jgi:geranylgeranyl pyrophosphate synthase
VTKPFELALARERRAVEAGLRALLARERDVPPRLRRAMAHSLFGGGKRLRPVLLLWAYDACLDRGRAPGVTRRAALDAACALEFIHTYSLIHDDLPAMDDDMLRRGRPTCHVAFDEPTAILAGDALQALAFGALARLGPGATGAAALIARAAGPAGMVGGQQDDLDAEGVAPRPALIRRIQRRKTAALLAASLGAGGALAGASGLRVPRLLAAGDALGQAFQQADDLLDACGSAAAAGKSVGKDAAAGKMTWVRLEGPDRARRRAARDGRSGLRRLRDAVPPGPAAERLLALAAGLWDRDR